MTHTPPILSLDGDAFLAFLRLLPPERISRMPDRVTVHADAGNAIWFARGRRWITTAPGDDTARRFGAQNVCH